MNKYSRIAFIKIFGAPVYIHWSALAFMAFIVIFSFKTPILTVIFMASYFGVILLHEFGHALFAHKLGAQVYRIDLGLIHGVCHYENPYEQKHNSLIAWGGVAMQTAIAVPVLLLAQISFVEKSQLLAPVVIFLGYINLLVALFNIAPSKLLDGGEAWRIIPILVREKKAKRTVNEMVKNKFNVKK